MTTTLGRSKTQALIDDLIARVTALEEGGGGGGGGGGSGDVGPFPFFGTHGTAADWERPAASEFSTIINQTIPGSGAPNPATLTDNPNSLPLLLRSGVPN